MNKIAIKEYTEEDYKEFFEWLLDKEVHINKMVDITLLDTHLNPVMYYPDEIKKLIETKSMQRLKRVAQLGDSIVGNENDFHTRFAHSIGAGNNAQKFFIHLFKENEAWKSAIERYGKKEEIFADIIQMYVHDIGHNILSHTLEKVLKGKKQGKQSGAIHEILGKRIVNTDQEIIDVFNSISPTLLQTLNNCTSLQYDLRGLKEGSIDFDRLDYLIRDTLYHGGYEDRDITEKLLENYDILVSEGNGNLKQNPVIKIEAKRDVRDFLERRKNGYQNCYWSNKSIAIGMVSNYFCRKIAEGSFDCELKNYITHCIQNGGNGIDLDEFKNWDDTRYYNEVINIAQNHPDPEIRELAIMCLPSLKGLTNFLFEAYDLDHIKSEDELTDSQKEVFYNVRRLVKEENLLHRRLLEKNDVEFVYLDAENENDIQLIFDELEQAGISRKKLDSMISWRKDIVLYNKKEPIKLKNKLDEIYLLEDYIRFNDEIDNKTVNGILALPMQMRENGFSELEITRVQERFKKYNFEHKKEKVNFTNCLMDSIECCNNMINEDGLEL